MNLYIIKHKTQQYDYYRFLVPGYHGNHYMDGTQVKERAAVFLDQAAAQEVCDSLFVAGFQNYEVVPFETVL